MKTPIAPSAVSRRGLLGLSLGFTLGMSLPQVAIAQPDILAIIGKDNYLFPAWGTTDEPNWPAIDATVARVAEVHKRLAARGIALVAPVLPSKKLFYADKLPAVDALTPEMLGRYAGIRDRLAAAGVPGFDVERLYRALQANGEPVYYLASSYCGPHSPVGSQVGWRRRYRARAGRNIQGTAVWRPCRALSLARATARRWA